MKKSVLLYSVAVAAGAFLLKWLEYQYAVRVFSTEIYITLIALLFAGLGVWAGLRMASPTRAAEFVKNAEALEYMGISNREYEVLELLAQGCSNKEITERLFVSGVIFLGVKRYRDQELGGVIRFGTAFMLGLGIAVVASLAYVLLWEVYLSARIMHSFETTPRQS